MEQKFYQCRHCGQIIAIVKKTPAPIFCCGEAMQELVPGVVEASKEKHIPEYEIKGNKVIVKVGSIPHPMLPEHHIEWISLQTKLGNQRKLLSVNGSPETCFSLCEGDEVEAVYAYCNLHGLWKK